MAFLAAVVHWASPQLPEQLLKVRELIGEGEGTSGRSGEGGWIGELDGRLPGLAAAC